MADLDFDVVFRPDDAEELPSGLLEVVVDCHDLIGFCPSGVCVGDVVPLVGRDDVAVEDRLEKPFALIVAALAGVPVLPAIVVRHHDPQFVVADRDPDVPRRRLAREALGHRHDSRALTPSVDEVAVENEYVLLATGPLEPAGNVGFDDRFVVGVLRQRQQRAPG
jgi:hypothetical protein